MSRAPLPASVDEIHSVMASWLNEALEEHAKGKDVQFFRQAARPESLLLFMTISTVDRYDPNEGKERAQEAGAAA